MACEKCWADAYMRMLVNGKGQAENYQELLEERKDNPCSEAEQRCMCDRVECEWCGPRIANRTMSRLNGK